MTFAFDKSLYTDRACEITPRKIILSRSSVPLFMNRFIDVATIAEVRHLECHEIDKLRSCRWVERTAFDLRILDLYEDLDCSR